VEILSKAQKTIERINRILDKALEDAKKEYHEAEGSYRDTGWDRYYTKMERLEKEIEELEKYRQVEAKLQQAEKALDRQRTVKKIFFKKLDTLAEGHKGEELFQAILKVCRERFERAEVEAMDA
jgi:hypothetical protein